MTVVRVWQWLGALALLGMVQPLHGADRLLATGHVPAVVKHLRSTGDLPDETPMNLAIGLPLRNSAALQAWLSDVYNPRSTNYHHWVTAAEFTTRFGPTEQQRDAVIAFARAHHLTVTRVHDNRMLLDVTGAASDIGKAFGVHLRQYRRPEGGGEFFAPDSEPAVPAEVPILDVGGLSNYRQPHPNLHAAALARSPQARANSGSGSGGAYMGGDFRAAYLPGVTLNGAGQTVALLEFDGFYAGDISNYVRQASLPAVPVQTVLLDGYNGTPGGGNNEVSLDIEMAIAMAPGLSNIISYEAGANGSANDILNRMASDNSARQISCSWSWGGGPSATTDQIFQEMAAQGQSFFCASGDSGAYTAGAMDNPVSSDTPVDSPYLTSVGATTLTTSGPGGSWIGESVWNWNNGTAGSGGISSYYAIPSWQQVVGMSANGGSTTMRNIPDVALTGDNIYVLYGNGSAGTFGGTSCAAPLWAGLIALVNQQAAAQGHASVGFINPTLYALGKSSGYGTYFHDITVGNNTNSASTNAYFAVSGYDLCTGWGTPAGSALINALLAPPDPLSVSPAVGFTATGLPGGPFGSNAVTFSLTNTGSQTLTWGVYNSASWLSVSATSGPLKTTAPETVTISLNAAATNLAVGTYNAGVWFSNLVTGVGAAREFTLTVTPQLPPNNGFESGNFANWTQSGNAVSTAVTTDSSCIHSGNYGVEAGPYGSLGYLSQTVATVPGQPYVLSFWLANPTQGVPNQFTASWNGNSLCNRTNLLTGGWTNMHFNFVAKAGSTTLTFGFRHDPAYFAFDDVSLQPVAASALRSLVKANTTVHFTMNTTTNATYQLQYVTSFSSTNWMNLGAPFTATNTTTVVTDPNATDSQRFYRVVLAP